MDLQELKRIREQMEKGVVIHRKLVVEMLEFAIDKIEKQQQQLPEASK